ncbi:response regulator transcription factor [Agromyces laixinhei]|uniref:response regulator transcription factor n=1 Tax=Agromyces laixinhei TaxID=2585717 RepID=UPI001117984D|nr:response regulator transcription factor [Agromyces laixinhei]
MTQVSLALVNDYEVVVRGLAAMLRSYDSRVRIVELDANRQVSEPVDIALVDTFGNVQENGATVRELAADPLVGAVVVYSWAGDTAVVDAALSNGARGYVSKALPARDLVAALEDVNHGDHGLYDGKATTTVLSGDWPGREEGLTQREAEILALVTQGLSNLEIADRAHLSINSVKTYIRNCYRRINVTSRTNAVLWGIEHGFRPDHTRISNPRRVLKA